MKPKSIEKQDQALLIAIGQKIKGLRKEQNLGYIELAEKIGISRNALSLIENGKVYFNFSTLLQILRYFKIKPDNFFQGLE